MKSQEQIKTLTELGLTLDQARTYLALTQASPATAKAISDISKIAKPDIYRIIPSLQEQGIVEKLVTKPASYQAIPMEHALPALLKRREAEQNRLRRKTEELLSDYRNNQSHGLLDSAEVVVVPGKGAILNRLNEALLKTRYSLCVITSHKRFSAANLEFEKVYREILRKGGKIRIATDRHIPQKSSLKMMQTFADKASFEVRFFEDTVPSVVGIFDGKEAYVVLTATARLAEASALWSSNPSFVALAQNYFENKWSKARPFLNLIIEAEHSSV